MPIRQIRVDPRPILRSAFIQSPLRPVVDRRLVVCQLCHVCQLHLADMDAVNLVGNCESTEITEATDITY